MSRMRRQQLFGSYGHERLAHESRWAVDRAHGRHSVLGSEPPLQQGWLTLRFRNVPAELGRRRSAAKPDRSRRANACLAPRGAADARALRREPFPPRNGSPILSFMRAFLDRRHIPVATL